MTAKTSFSTETDVSKAVATIARDLQSASPQLVLYFCSAQFEPSAVAPAMAQAFPKATLVGCTTAGEIVTGRMLDHSLVAMAFGSDLIRRAEVAVAPNLGAQPRAAISGALSKLGTAFGKPIGKLDPATHFGIVLTDGLSGAEEAVMDAIGDAANIPFIGGSAGDDLAFRKTHVFAGAEVHTGATVLAVIEAVVPFEVIKTQSFTVRTATLVATKVDVTSRRVLEFNGQPATKAYAAAIGVSEADLPKYFMRNPLGLVVDGAPFVRSPQRVDGATVVFYCQILEGTELHVLDATDIVKDTKKALAAVQGPTAFINFHCILRTLELKDKGQCPAYGKLFQRVPTIGFSTYGESYIGHINQTSTIVAFKAA